MSERILYVAQRGQVVPWEIPKRDLKEGEVRVDVKSVGINPIDWKTIDNKLADGAGQGCDFAGTIVEVGPSVTDFKIGDTVAGGIGGGDVDKKENGSFTDLLTVDSHLLFKFPVKLSSSAGELSKPALPTTFEQAASLGIAIVTTALAFEHHKPSSKDEWVLIYGVTGSVGFIAAQYARNIGYNVIGVSAELKGVSDAIQGIHWLDRNDKEWPAKAKKIAGGQIKLTLDSISLTSELDEVFEAASPKGILQFLLPIDFPKDLLEKYEGVDLEHPNFFFLTQEVKKFGPVRVEDPKNTIKRAPQIVKEINEQLSKNQILTLPVVVINGFENLNAGLAKNREGVRGKKVVVDK